MFGMVDTRKVLMFRWSSEIKTLPMAFVVYLPPSKRLCPSVERFGALSEIKFEIPLRETAKNAKAKTKFFPHHGDLLLSWPSFESLFVLRWL
jgi:hypothetical protein